MKFSLRTLLVLLTCVACFVGGWVARREYVKPVLIPTTCVTGVVVRTRTGPTGRYLAISVGTDDGTEIGAQVDLYSNETFVGRGIVTKAEYNASAVKITHSFGKTPIAEGAHAQVALPQPTPKEVY